MPLPRLARPFGWIVLRLRGHFLYIRPVWTRSRSGDERVIRAFELKLELRLRAGFGGDLLLEVLGLPAGLVAGLGFVRPDLLGTKGLLEAPLEDVRGRAINSLRERVEFVHRSGPFLYR